MCALPALYYFHSPPGRCNPQACRSGSFDPLLHCLAVALATHGYYALCDVQVMEQQRELVDAAIRRGGDLRAAAAAALQHSVEAVQQLRRHLEGQARLVPHVQHKDGCSDE